MILGRDWKTFCNYFARIHVPSTQLTRLAFSPDMVDLPDYKAPMGKPFLEMIQKSLLESFCTQVQDVEDVEITGLVSPSLLQSVIAEVISESRPEPDTSELVAAMEDAHNQATNLFESGNIIEAGSTWQRMLELVYSLVRTLADEIDPDQPREPPVTIPLLNHDKEIRDAASALYFKGCANLAGCYLYYQRNPPPGLSKEFAFDLGRGALCRFGNAVRAANENREWSPPPTAVVNLLCEASESRRLFIQSDKKVARRSWKREVGIMLVQAQRLAPGHPQVQAEVRHYWEWVRDVEEEVDIDSESE